MIWAIGFDLSLRAPAAVALPLDWKPGDWKRAKAWTAKPPEPKAKDDYAGQMARYAFIAEWACKCVGGLGNAEVHGAVEAYGFSMNNSMSSVIMGSGEIVKLALWERCDLPLRAYTASACRKLSLGYNPRRSPGDPRDHVKLVIQRACFDVFKVPKHFTEDECDALLVAQHLLSDLGGRILSIPAPEKPARRRS